VTKGSKDAFSESKTFQVSTFQGGLVMNHIYLRKEGPNHFLYVLGKNGEPKSAISVEVSIRDYKYENVISMSTSHLQTNKEGRVGLGEIKHDCHISVSVPLFGLSEQFSVRQSKQLMNYVEQLDTIENEEIVFPVLFKELSPKKLMLIKVDKNQNVLEDMFRSVEFETVSNFNRIHIKNLSVGHYQLILKNTDQSIAITVHRGTPWESNNFILKKNCLFENRVAQNVVKIHSVSVEEA